MGPYDHHASRPLPRLGGSHQARGVARQPDRRGGVFHRHAALHQPALQLRQSIPALSAHLQTSPQGEGKILWLREFAWQGSSRSKFNCFHLSSLPDTNNFTPGPVSAVSVHLPCALFLQLPLLYRCWVYLLHPLHLPHDVVRLSQGFSVPRCLLHSLPSDQHHLGGVLCRHSGGRQDGWGLEVGAHEKDGW